jgi:hypothetical protein
MITRQRMVEKDLYQTTIHSYKTKNLPYTFLNPLNCILFIRPIDKFFCCPIELWIRLNVNMREIYSTEIFTFIFSSYSIVTLLACQTFPLIDNLVWSFQDFSAMVRFTVIRMINLVSWIFFEWKYISFIL